jgi:SlyX protein
MHISLEQIETKIAYLERTSAELSDVIFRQDREIQALQAQVNALRDRLNAVQADDLPRALDQERPPHY